MDQPDPTPTARATRTALKVALVSAGVVAGAIGATAIGASATTAGTGSTSSSTSASGSAPTAAPNGPAAPGSGADGPGAHGPGPGGGQNPAETVLTDAAMKAKLTAAAKAAVPGATVDKVETDSGDAKYEVHMTKTDGSRVTVKFDAALKQTAVEDGMGK